METEKEVALQDEAPEDVLPEGEGKDTKEEPIGEEPKEEVSTQQFDPNKFVPLEQFAKMQSSLQRNETRLLKETGSLRERNTKIAQLSLAAMESRRKLDPLSEGYQNDTSEEKAYKEFLSQAINEDQEVDRQSKQDTDIQKILDAQYQRLTKAGISPYAPEVLSVVGDAYAQYGIDGVRDEVSTLIAQKRVTESITTNSEAVRSQKRTQAKEEGQTVVDNKGPSTAKSGTRVYSRAELRDFDFYKANKDDILLAIQENRIKE